MSLRSPLGRALGRGSAKEGVHHWWTQRVTAIALVPLSIWFAVSLLSLPSLDHVTLSAWIGQTWTTLLLILLVLVGAWHSQLGVRVVIEDYVHDGGLKTLVLVLSTFVHALVAAGGVLAVLKVFFGATS
jgi:succinate dehydrogenase / fumarate reductase, membrane anchor subunit